MNNNKNDKIGKKKLITISIISVLIGFMSSFFLISSAFIPINISDKDKLCSTLWQYQLDYRLVDPSKIPNLPDLNKNTITWAKSNFVSLGCENIINIVEVNSSK